MPNSYLTQVLTIPDTPHQSQRGCHQTFVQNQSSYIGKRTPLHQQRMSPAVPNLFQAYDKAQCHSDKPSHQSHSEAIGTQDRYRDDPVC